MYIVTSGHSALTPTPHATHCDTGVMHVSISHSQAILIYHGILTLCIDIPKH